MEDRNERINKRVEELYSTIPESKINEVYREKRRGFNIFCLIILPVFIALGVVMIVLGMPEPEISGFTIGCGVFLMLFGIVFVIGIQIFFRDKTRVIKFLLKIKARNEINKELEQEYMQDYVGEFHIDKEIHLYDVSHFRNARLLIDTNNKQFVYVLGKDYSSIIQFKDILSYEVYEDNNSVVKGSAGRALIGGAFFGLTGAVIGSSGKRKVSNYCSSLKLLVRINDINNPQIEITFINSQQEKDSYTYRNCIKSLQEISAYFEYMMNNKTLEAENSSLVENPQAEKSKKEQLLELKELLEDGLITEEEYNKMRENILK